MRAVIAPTMPLLCAVAGVLAGYFAGSVACSLLQRAHGEGYSHANLETMFKVGVACAFALGWIGAVVGRYLRKRWRNAV